MVEVEPLYLTCTASQAQEFNASNDHGIRSLNELLEVRAESHSDVCVAGFPEQPSGLVNWTVLKFSTHRINPSMASTSLTAIQLTLHS